MEKNNKKQNTEVCNNPPYLMNITKEDKEKLKAIYQKGKSVAGKGKK